MTNRAEAQRMADAIRTLLRTFTIDETRYPAARGRMRYNAVDFQALHFMADRPDARATDLARHLGVAATTVQSSVNRLVNSGLVERAPGPHDRRVRRLSLTTDGRAMVDDIQAQDEENCARMLNALEAPAASSFVDAIEAISNAMNAEADGSETPR